jgi:hypothetical protein
MSNKLAVKALNQYRKRDIFSYLGLRYYLESSAGRECRWIKDICTRLATNIQHSSYLKTHHFKDYSDGQFVHRNIYLPSPNEVLAETALISEMSKYETFQPKPYVYSYRFAEEDDKTGVFQPYFNGFKERQKHIADACWKLDEGVVLYTDIKKFYPSINAKSALDTWNRLCEESGIDIKFKNLGLEILKKHNKVSVSDDTGKGILTGPIFSHVIANLLLDAIDVKMYEVTNGNYCRYVDDVVLIGKHDEVTKWRSTLESLYDELGLDLHDGDKDFTVSIANWLEGENDFEKSFGIEWISLIGDLKRFLLANPKKITELKVAFKENNIRIPIIDYSNAVKESTYLQRFQDWRGQYKWATKAVKKLNITSLLEQAKKCEVNFKIKIDDILSIHTEKTPYEEKRTTPKLRYLSGRLLYLMDDESLCILAAKLSKYPELYFIEKVMDAVATRNVSEVMKMGVDATHVASQLLRVNNEKVTIGEAIENSPVFEQSLSILDINGVEHDFAGESTKLSLLAKADNIRELMNSEDGFIKEFACLHGALPSRHQQTLDISFDRDEELALDVLNQLQQSSHC